MRLDLYLVEKGYSPSRTKAQALIQSGAVEILKRDRWEVATHPSLEVSESTKIRIQDSEILKYVSRGGLKLENALKHCGVNPTGFRVLDIGQSTGGFTDCLLKLGAQSILGFDVGHGQLHPSLKIDQRVISLEGVHVAKMQEFADIKNFLDEGIDLCVVDVSFISLKVVLEALSQIRSPFKLLALVKPQFEVGRAGLGKGGLVKESRASEQVLKQIEEFASGLGFKVHAMFPSVLAGGDGNQEYFCFAEWN